jgi:hypothetical protein
MSQNSVESAQLASLSPQDLQTIADLVVAKLTAQNAGNVLPKQVVASSNLVTRSTKTPYSLHPPDYSFAKAPAFQTNRKFDAQEFLDVAHERL